MRVTFLSIDNCPGSTVPVGSGSHRRITSMRGPWRTVAAAVVLVACCAGPALAGGAVLAALTGFVARSWCLFALVAVLCVAALIGVRRRSNPTGGDC